MSQPHSQTALAERIAATIGIPLADPSRVTDLSVTSISKHYGPTKALDGVTIEFRPGTVHTILGENGSGKSTLLKLLSGVTKQTSGTLILNGEERSPNSPLDMQKLGLGTVFQEVLIAPQRSARDNVLLGFDGLMRRNIPRARRNAVAELMLRELGETQIDPDAMAGDLPLAAQQIVVLARAFLKQPSILLLDEATAALDLGDREKVFRAISDHAAAGHIVIFISHRMDEVQRLSDHISVLRSGELIETIERADVTTEKLLRLMAPEAHAHAE